MLLIKLGIRPERIEKGKPTQNGRHERIHRTLKAETASPPRANRLAQQRAFDMFRRDYNEVRPHEALGQVPPAVFYESSPRKLTKALVDPTYPESFETCRVHSDGTMKWNRFHFVLADVLASELVGVERNDATDDWTLHYGPLELGRLDARGRFKRKPA